MLSMLGSLARLRPVPYRTVFPSSFTVLPPLRTYTWGNHLAYEKGHKEPSHHPELKKNTHPEVGKKVRKTHSHAGDPSDLKERRKTKKEKKAELHQAEAEDAKDRQEAEQALEKLLARPSRKTVVRALEPTEAEKQQKPAPKEKKSPKKKDKGPVIAADELEEEKAAVRKRKPKKPLAKHHVVPVVAAEKTGPAPSPENKFSEFKLDKALLVGLDYLGIQTPTPIQEKGIPEILSGGDVILSAETGTGKTLAFLLPLIQQLRDEQKRGIKLREKYPRALVLVPNKDLARQITTVLNTLTKRAGLELVVATVTAADKAKKQARALERAPDIVVASPGRLIQHRAEERVYFSDVKHVVIDECDTLYSEAFSETLKSIITPIQGMRDGGKEVQFLFVSATIPQKLDLELTKSFPKVKKVQTESLGKPLSNLKHQFVSTTEEKRLDVLLEMLEQDRVYEYEKVLIFCASVSRCNRVKEVLEKNKHRVALFHGAIQPQLRARNFESFLRGETQILISTDIASRGLDTLNVGHVILFDFPLDGSEYLRKTGRAGRAGLAGRATSFVTKKDHPFAGQLEQALETGESIAKLGSSSARPQRLRKAFAAKSDARLMVREGGRHNKNFNPFRKRVPKNQKSNVKNRPLQKKGPAVRSKKFEDLLKSQDSRLKREDRSSRNVKK